MSQEKRVWLKCSREPAGRPTGLGRRDRRHRRVPDVPRGIDGLKEESRVSRARVERNDMYVPAHQAFTRLKRT